MYNVDLHCEVKSKSPLRKGGGTKKWQLRNGGGSRELPTSKG